MRMGQVRPQVIDSSNVQGLANDNFVNRLILRGVAGFGIAGIWPVAIQ
jgi:hypothetical protein